MNTPEMQSTLASDKAECEARAGSMASDRIFYCMADKGYNLRTARDHLNACRSPRA